MIFVTQSFFMPCLIFSSNNFEYGPSGHKPWGDSVTALCGFNSPDTIRSLSVGEYRRLC